MAGRLSENGYFSQSLRQTQVLILKILNVFLRLIPLIAGRPPWPCNKFLIFGQPPRLFDILVSVLYRALSRQRAQALVQGGDSLYILRECFSNNCTSCPNLLFTTLSAGVRSSKPQTPNWPRNMPSRDGKGLTYNKYVPFYAGSIRKLILCVKSTTTPRRGGSWFTEEKNTGGSSSFPGYEKGRPIAFLLL